MNLEWKHNSIIVTQRNELTAARNWFQPAEESPRPKVITASTYTTHITSIGTNNNIYLHD